MNRPSTAKRIRQNAARSRRNRALRTELRTRLKTLRVALQAGNAEAAGKLLRPMISALDKAASKKLIKKARASRTVARLSRRLHQLTASPAS
ncbi:MAG: 30S ribosomal protein S20 [Nitrospirota bacterium]